MNIFVKSCIGICVLASGLLISCEDQLPADCTPSLEYHYLYLTESSIYINTPSRVDDYWLYVRSENTRWQFKDYDDSWLTLDPVSGNEEAWITIIAEENTSPTMRTCMGLFESAEPGYDYSVPLFFCQAAAEPSIMTDSTFVVFAASTSYKSIDIKANVEWTATTSSDWLTLTPSEDGISLKMEVSENLTEVTRSGTVIVSSTDASLSVSRIISVTQLAPATPQTDVATLELAYEGGSYLLSVTSEVAWTAQTSESWIQVDPVEGVAGKTNLVIESAPNNSVNDRKGFVSILIGGKERVRIEILQRGLYLEISSRILNLTSSSQQSTLQVRSNLSWSVLEKPDWITATVVGTGYDADLILTVLENQSQLSRSGIVKIGCNDYDLTAQVFVTQQGKYFSINPTAFANISSKGGIHTVQIMTDDQWTATSTSPWMFLSRYYGEGPINVDMMIPDNPSLNIRTDTTTFTPNYASPIRIVTRQNGRYLEVDVKAFSFFQKGGRSVEATISTDASYTIAVTESWLSVQQQGNIFTVTATRNDNENNREGLVIVSMTDLQNGENYAVEIPVVQKGSAESGIRVFGFGEDKVWDIVMSSGMSISVTGFSEDKVWDTVMPSGMTIGITGFSEDKKWE